MKFFSTMYIEDDVIEQIKGEQHTYYSKEFEMFMVTDKVYEMIANKYNFTDDENLENERVLVDIVLKTVEEMIDFCFMDIDVKFFGHHMYLCEYGECVRVDIQDTFNEETGEITFMETDDWGIDVTELLKLECSIGFQNYLEDEMKKYLDEGYNLDIMKNVYNTGKRHKEMLVNER